MTAEPLYEEGCPCGHPMEPAYKCQEGMLIGPCSDEDCNEPCRELGACIGLEEGCKCPL